MEGTQAKQQYSVWQTPIAAFYNKSFYVNAANNWPGSGALYMFVMCLIATVVAVAPVAVFCYNAVTDKSLPQFLQQLPRVTLQDGQVSIDKPSPYQIKDQQGTVVAEFRCDQSGEPKLSSSGPNPPIIVTRDKIFIAEGTSGHSEGQTHSFSDFKANVSFDGNDLYRLIQQIMIWVPVALFLFWSIGNYLGHLFQMLVFGGFAQLLCSGKSHAISFGAGMRLASIAMTPSIVISIALGLIEILAPASKSFVGAALMGMRLVGIILAVMYLVIAVKALEGTTPDAPPAPPAPA